MDDNELLMKLFNDNVTKLNSIGYYPLVRDIKFNTKIYRTHAMYCETNMTIEIGYKMFKSASQEEISNVIMHELTHNLDHTINGKCSRELDGHGESWQKIANDINSKLGTNISRFTDIKVPTVLQENLKHHYVIKCAECGREQDVTSKCDTYEGIRKPRCSFCNLKNWIFVAKGQLGFNTRTKERCIILDNY